MTKQQFEILCRAYWPDCKFVNGILSVMCYPSDTAETGVQLYKGDVFAWSTRSTFQEIDKIKPEDIVREVYNDNRTV